MTHAFDQTLRNDLIPQRSDEFLLETTSSSSYGGREALQTSGNLLPCVFGLDQGESGPHCSQLCL